MKLDVTKHCDLVAGGYAIDASMLEHMMGWPKGALRSHIELCDGVDGWEATVRFTGSQTDDEGDPVCWTFTSAEGVTLLVLND